ncbi:HK97 gp10 family phage protein [Mesorhizobium sp. NBSH29]|uniref:HK97-gp10 family putative phage morphogenesis protein n=1 Tax=Mesorhizobium sp. NBSH29 TaxID=2654249 RepID=UPI0018C02678|nr:HK97-gp10 family putative phage morphogenesis protein [Mesorhizobium sp. NBSH29]QPC87414.1 HK97 gp10 family phage protein [Mesorhizobium sp. NBSH29]
MRTSKTVKIEGLRDLDEALGKLTKATAKGVLNRTLKKAATPIRDSAQSHAPSQTGELKRRIVMSAKKPKGHDAGNNVFAEAMRSGATRAEAGQALRGARKANPNDFAEIFVGPLQSRNKQAAIKTIVQEFGSENQPGHPYMRPAWDGNKDKALSIIVNELGGEIMKAAQRLAKRAAKGK